MKLKISTAFLLFITLLLGCNRYNEKTSLKDNLIRILANISNGSVNSTDSGTTNVQLSIQGQLKGADGKPLAFGALSVSGGGISTKASIVNKSMIFSRGDSSITASQVSFTDLDSTSGTIGGDVTINKASNEANITHYQLFWSDSSGSPITLISKIRKTGNDIIYTFNSGTQIPTNSGYLVVYTSNEATLASSGVLTKISDIGDGITTDEDGKYTATLGLGSYDFSVADQDGNSLGAFSMALDESNANGKTPEPKVGAGSQFGSSITGMTVETSTDKNKTKNPPTFPATSLTVSDIAYDETEGKISGTLKIGRATDDSDINSYSLYWGNSTNPKLTSIASLSKKDGDVIFKLAGGTVLPKGATSFSVFTKNKAGEMSSGLITPIPQSLFDTLSSLKSLGGNVSSLNNTGLVLQFGSKELAINGNGRFKFPFSVKTGNSFEVKIKSQPSAQTCYISGNIGTVRDNITSILVNCNVQTYTLSMNTTGLTGSLVLSNNGKTYITINSNGNTLFSLISGLNYNLSVSTQPTNQTCTVTNGTGTNIQSNVTGIGISCLNNLDPPTNLTYSNMNANYVAGMTITNNVPSYTGSITLYTLVGTLPSGLVFNSSNGLISGIPTQVIGATNYIITGSNSVGNTSTTITLSVIAPTISYTGTFTYIQNTAVSIPVTANGAFTNYTISSGSLPTGLILNSTSGIISGTVTATAGSYTATIQETTGGVTASTSVTFTINSAPSITYSGTPLNLTLGTSIGTIAPTVANGTPNAGGYSISPSVTSLGLSFDTNTGYLTGTPTTTLASTSHTISVVTNNGTATVSFNITITETAPASIAYSSSIYSFQPSTAITSLSPTITGGNVSLSYSITAGALPTGLSMNASGVISGTPNTTSTYTPTITVSNSGGSASVTLTFNIVDPCTGYTSVSGDDRYSTLPNSSVLCDSGMNNAWIRFTGSHVQLATSMPPVSYCNTDATGYLTTGLPSAGQVISGTTCFNWGGNSCNFTYNIQIANCGGSYYVYQLPSTSCSLRYCTQ